MNEDDNIGGTLVHDIELERYKNALVDMIIEHCTVTSNPDYPLDTMGLTSNEDALNLLT